MIDRAVRTEDERRVVAMLRWVLIVTFVVIGYVTLKYVATVMAPLIAAFAIAYLLQPVLEALAARGVSRSIGGAVLLGGFLGGVGVAVVAAVPRIAEQLGELVQQLPLFLDTINAWVHKTFGVTLPKDWTEFLAGKELKAMVDTASGPLRNFAAVALGGVLGFLSVLGEVLLVPVFAYYFLVDWKGVVTRIQSIVPPRQRARVGEMVHEIDAVVSGWVRGQGIVTVILAILYAVAFSILGVPAAVPVGLVVGTLTVIPFVGTLVGAAIALTITLVSGGVSPALQVAGVIGVLHLLEAVVLTPKIVGHRVGLSESAALFAVLAGGKLLGFVGVVLAVPLAATVGVLVRHGLRFYEHTEFYGKESDAEVVVTSAMAAVLPVETTNLPHTKPSDEPTAATSATSAAEQGAER
jgi:predicted PurR-regulated permease PerM